MELNGKVVLVTGGSRGIGQATAHHLAGLGAKVVLAARRKTDLQKVAEAIQNVGGQALAVPTDVTDPQAVEALVKHALDRFGRVDALVNNAGRGTFAPIIESHVDHWRQMLEVNLTGLYLCTRAVLKPMLAQRQGQIVNVLSIAARAAFKGASAYCASKAGALAFTRVLAEEVRTEGIRVTALCPGSVATPFWDGIDPRPDVALMQQPEDLARVVGWVLSQPDGIVIDEVITTPPLGIL